MPLFSLTARHFLMAQPDFNEHAVHGASGGKKWFSVDAVDASGTQTTVNFFAKDEEEVRPLVQGLMISHNLAFGQPVLTLGTKQDYDDLTRD